MYFSFKSAISFYPSNGLPVFKSSSPTPPLNKVFEVAGPDAFLAAFIIGVDEVSAAFFAFIVCCFKNSVLSGGFIGLGARDEDTAAVAIIEPPKINAVVVPIAIALSS